MARRRNCDEENQNEEDCSRTSNRSIDRSRVITEDSERMQSSCTSVH